MNLQKSIQVIQNVCASFQGNLAQHQEIQSALNFVITQLNEKIEVRPADKAKKETIKDAT